MTVLFTLRHRAPLLLTREGVSRVPHDHNVYINAALPLCSTWSNFEASYGVMSALSVCCCAWKDSRRIALVDLHLVPLSATDNRHVHIPEAFVAREQRPLLFSGREARIRF